MLLDLKRHLCKDVHEPMVHFIDTETVMHAFISSHLDFWKALDYRWNNTWIWIKRWDHAVLHLFWLLYTVCLFKIFTALKVLHGQAPSYTTELVNPYKPSCNLRSSSSDLLAIPTGKQMAKKCSFTVCVVSVRFSNNTWTAIITYDHYRQLCSYLKRTYW